MYATVQNAAKLLVGNKIDLQQREVRRCTAVADGLELGRRNITAPPNAGDCRGGDRIRAEASHDVRGGVLPPEVGGWHLVCSSTTIVGALLSLTAHVVGSALQVSAKTRAGVRQAFEEVVQKILDTPDLLAAARCDPAGNASLCSQDVPSI